MGVWGEGGGDWLSTRNCGISPLEQQDNFLRDFGTRIQGLALGLEALVD